MAHVQATQYPVQGTLAINSPYPAYLSDYANPNIEKLILNLTLTDLNISNKRVRLKLFIQKQNSLIARSADNIIGEPAIILDGGVPQRFTSIELAAYFKMENLQGINGGAYNQPLAEGVYNIGFEVYDYFTGNKLSDRISQMFWLMLSDPPLLNMPRNRENIVETNPNNPQIVFQWTPRTTQVTNTEYEFTLSELWDEAGGHYQQFLAAIPKFQTTVANTTLLYGIAEPPLLAGRTYAWRIRAKAKAGFEDIGMYRQDGYSEIFVFTYGGQCAAVQGVNIEVKGYDRMYISWQPNPNQNLYKVAYRKYTPGNNWEWREVETFTPYLNLFDLEANTAYEIKVGGICNDGLVSYSTPQTNKTLQNGQISGINCGQAPVIDIANQALLQHLSANQVVMAGDFPITITRVEGGSGVYSGEGWVKVPWLADTKIKVTYTGIKVNTDYKLIDGFFETTYDPEGKNIGDVDQLIEDLNGIFTGGTDVGKVVTGSDTTKYSVAFDIPDPCSECGFAPDGKGGGTISFGGGKTITVDKLPTTIKDKEGDIYEAKTDSTVNPPKVVITKTGNAGGTAVITAADKTKIDLTKGRVDFAAADGMKYAFDAWQPEYDKSSAWAKKYEKLNGGNYRVSAKAIAPGEADKVLAKITLTDNTLKADSIQFVNGKGTIYEKKKINETDYEITITGGPADDAQEIYAVYPQAAGKPLNLGKLLVAGYAIQKRKLVLVPVNGAPVNKESIAATLNSIYNKVCVKWEVGQAESFYNKSWDIDKDGKLKVEGSGAWSALTDEMKALNNAYRSNPDIDNNAIYLFVLPQATSNVNGVMILGDMPRAKQFGYLFTNGGTGADLGTTAAHEVGHGVYRLKHVFEYNGIGQGLIDPLNVMDYPSGGALSKYQWDIIHDPGIVVGLFEKDEAAESYYVTRIDSTFRNRDNKTVSFLTPVGSIVTLPQKELYNVLFAYGATYKQTNQTSSSYSATRAVGTLDGFSTGTNENNYAAYTFSQNERAYINRKTGEPYKQQANIDMIDGFIYPVPCGNEYNLYKFPLNSFAHLQNGSGNYLDFEALTQLFAPFSSSTKPIQANGKAIKQTVTKVIYSNCLYCMNEKTVLMTQSHCETPELIWVDKIAQMRVVFPEYFEQFTQGEEVSVPYAKIYKPNLQTGYWEIPVNFYDEVRDDIGSLYDTVLATYWPWGNYLASHPEVKAKYQTDKPAFFQAFYTQFENYIQNASQSSGDFWATATEATTAKDFVAQVRKEAMFKLQQAPVDKKQIALKKIAEATSYWLSSEEEFIKVLASFKKEEAKDVLQYMEQQIGIKKLYDNFYNHSSTWTINGKQNLTAVLTLISSMITASGYSTIDKAKEEGFIDNIGALPKLEADLFKFKNLNWSFAGENKIDIEGYGTVPYNQIVSVRMEGSFTFNNQRYPKGTILQMPAIQAALMSHINTVEVGSKAGWLAFDLGTFALGIGGAKILFTAGNYVRKTIVAADLIGSTAGIMVQSLNNDAISDELRSKIQIASMLLTLPNVVTSIAKVNKVVDELDVLINTRKRANGSLLTEQELTELENIRNGLREGVEGVGRQTWNGFANIFKANADEIAEATAKIKNYRTTTGNLTGGNYGYLEGTVNGTVIDNKMWRSGTALADEPKIFTAIEVEGAGGKTWLRTTDSEYKMLNKLASELGGTLGSIKPNITGEFKIISENPYCASCQGIIQQFNEMFPNVKLILVDGAK